MTAKRREVLAAGAFTAAAVSAMSLLPEQTLAQESQAGESREMTLMAPYPSPWGQATIEPIDDAMGRLLAIELLYRNLTASPQECFDIRIDSSLQTGAIRVCIFSMAGTFVTSLRERLVGSRKFVTRGDWVVVPSGGIIGAILDMIDPLSRDDPKKRMIASLPAGKYKVQLVFTDLFFQRAPYLAVPSHGFPINRGDPKPGRPRPPDLRAYAQGIEVLRSNVLEFENR
jgi:hypothetical protein